MNWWGKAYEEYPVEHDKIFKMETSRRAFEEDVSMVGTGLIPIMNEGEGVTYDTMHQGFVTRYTHLQYGGGVVITRNMVEDDLYDVLGKQRVESLAFSARQTVEIVAANVLNRAFNSSYTGGDGKEMIANNHPNVSGGTWSNTTPTPADLSEAALEQACIDIAKWTDDRGRKIVVRPTKLVIPVDLAFTAERILGSNLQVGTANNDINALKSLGKFKEGYFVYHYLTDPDAWFLLTDVQNGLKCFTRRPMEFTNDNDFDSDNAKYKVTFRTSYGWTDPRRS